MSLESRKDMHLESCAKPLITLRTELFENRAASAERYERIT